MIAGSKDLIKPEESAAIAGAIPGARLRILEGEGHVSYIVFAVLDPDILELGQKVIGLKEAFEMEKNI